MSNIVDAVGKACPIPVILAKKEIDEGEKLFSVRVDNQTAVENLVRLAQNQGYAISTQKKDDGIISVLFNKRVVVSECEKIIQEAERIPGNWAIFVGHEGLGGGDMEAGLRLMKMFFYTIAQKNDLPGAILFMNGGVKIPTLESEIVNHLKTLESKGCEILSCGTCLNHYGLKDKLQVGAVSNMFDIVDWMQRADKVITL